MDKQFICIRCPKGCIIQVELKDNEIVSMQGQTCNRGKAYVQEEITLPKRIVTSTVAIENASHDVLPVVTDQPIEKKYVFKLMEIIRKHQCVAPIYEKQIIIENVFNTGVNVIATRSMDNII